MVVFAATAKTSRNSEGEMKIIEDYVSHHYVKEYGKSNLFCPICGRQEVWTEKSEGDFYVGSESICVACESTLHLDFCCRQSESNPEDTARRRSMVDQLKTGVTATVKNERGR
jgi:hypothetical protein